MPKEEPTAKLMTEKCDQLYDDFEKMISAGAL
jgi:hypothetical protein